MELIPLKEFKKQYTIAEKLWNKFKDGKWTETDRQKWLSLDLKVRQVVLGA